MQNTAYRFYRQMQENTATKYIPGVLASACELTEGAKCKKETEKELFQLHKSVSEYFVKNEGDKNTDILKIKTLLYSYLLQRDETCSIPPSLQPDMNFVLEHSHQLLNGLLNIVMEQRFVTSVMNVIEFSQLLTQGMWFHSNQLLQQSTVQQQHDAQAATAKVSASSATRSTYSCGRRRSSRPNVRQIPYVRKSVRRRSTALRPRAPLTSTDLSWMSSEGSPTGSRGGRTI